MPNTELDEQDSRLEQAEAASATADNSDKPRVPRGVGTLAFTEFWERFSFYGLNGILTFYLLYTASEGGLGIDAASASGIVGAYGGSVYLAQLLGSWMGERVISPKWMVFIGGIIIAAGHVALAFISGMTGLAIGLGLIILGTGALKTNITNIVGLAVEGQDEGRRDVGFAYFYLAINMGAVTGPLASGFAQNEWGFHVGFGLAAIGMLVSLGVYMASMAKLPAKSGVVERPIEKSKLVRLSIIAVVVLLAIIVILSSGLLPASSLSAITTVLILASAAWYFIMMLGSKEVTKDEKRRVSAYLPLFLAGGLFFGLLFQQSTTIAILISERVDLVIAGWSVPVAWITMLAQFAAVLITPFVTYFWGKSGNSGPGAPSKFAVGMFHMGCAYIIMLLVLKMYEGALIPLLLIVLVMMAAGASEVFVGPVSLSLATRIGPERFRSQMVGLNFLTLSLGSAFSGLFGQLYTVISDYSYFICIIGAGVIVGIVLWIFRRKLQENLYAGL